MIKAGSCPMSASLQRGSFLLSVCGSLSCSSLEEEGPLQAEPPHSSWPGLPLLLILDCIAPLKLQLSSLLGATPPAGP